MTLWRFITTTAVAMFLSTFHALTSPSPLPNLHSATTTSTCKRNHHFQPRQCQGQYDDRQARHPKCNSQYLSSILHTLNTPATVENVTPVPANGSYGEGASDPAYPVNPTNLPPLCAVIFQIDYSTTASYRFGLFLPDKLPSTKRLLVVGNGGFSGGINWLDMAAGPHHGMAALSTDTGHNSTALETSWANGRAEKKELWGWRAMHGSVVLGKQIFQRYYQQPDHDKLWTYYSGCSTGGRQGLRELQEFPDSFDGALIGAPAWWTARLNPFLMQIGLYNVPADDSNPYHIPLNKFSLLLEEVIRQCDNVDGVQDGIVSSPDKCEFDLGALVCSEFGTNISKCLTVEQAETARKVYEGWLSEDGELLYPGLTLSSENQWSILLGGTVPSPYGLGYVRDFLLDNDDRKLDWTGTSKLGKDIIDKAQRLDPGHSSAIQYDISNFKDRGGKVILYHGLADGLVPEKGSWWYYNKTIDTFGGDLDGVREFIRYFQIPGMGHCFSTPDCKPNAPWNIGGAFQAGLMGSDTWSVPGFEDVDHDALLALMAWTEEGKAVDKLVATTWHRPTDSNTGVFIQRPICPWPEKAVYDGVGDVNEAGSWECAMEKVELVSEWQRRVES
ncbi:Putative feruloyl esterase B precursor [Podospora comata]|uniref:Carboxylic ester hydrolase n=1 Tax=Podospora comata TaxID=48703 RepID=A0ABY6SFH9_PODCO|nr:Putative feruloyl esterase B precursor [Podospora comata]